VSIEEATPGRLGSDRLVRIKLQFRARYLR
jgi:hypothetical protein